MDRDWATQQLDLIRTMMERGVLYQRALAPAMFVAGATGVIAALFGVYSGIKTTERFFVYWLVASLVAVAGVFVVTRRQAIRDAEPFWSPPTRRVAWAMLPGLVSGLVLSFFWGRTLANPEGILWLPMIWLMSYGSAVHAAGFFTPRGTQWFGKFFLILGTIGVLLIDRLAGWGPPDRVAHLVMGLFFGGAHLVYATLLYRAGTTGKSA